MVAEIVVPAVIVGIVFVVGFLVCLFRPRRATIINCPESIRLSTREGTDVWVEVRLRNLFGMILKHRGYYYCPAVLLVGSDTASVNPVAKEKCLCHTTEGDHRFRVTFKAPGLYNFCIEYEQKILPIRNHNTDVLPKIPKQPKQKKKLQVRFAQSTTLFQVQSRPKLVKVARAGNAEPLLPQINTLATGPVYRKKIPTFPDWNEFARNVDSDMYDQYIIEQSASEIFKCSIDSKSPNKIICITPQNNLSWKQLRDILQGNELKIFRNIKRVTGVLIGCGDLQFNNRSINISLKCSKSECKSVYKMFKLLLEAKHYRSMAGDHGQKRNHYQNAMKKNFHATLMLEANRRAMEYYFTFNNKKRPLCEIDLHDLRAFSNKQKQIPGEAWEKLTKRMEDPKLLHSYEWLEIIVGAGIHSEGEQQIRPMIEKNLVKNKTKFKIFKKAKYQYSEVNKGSLVITFKKYNGPEPCYGYFYCPYCDKAWCSKYSRQGCKKTCNECGDYEALPLKLSKNKPCAGL